jgi:predicted transposase/invertase (TIGR01784 family)
MRYLDPKNDLTFKKIFGEHPDILMDFLNAILPLAPNKQIVSLEYLPSEQVPRIPGLKNSIVDVKCTDNFDRQFIVEMQVLWTDSFKQRVIFNASKAYIKPLEKGGEYSSLKPVYAINLVDDIFEPEDPDYYHYYEIVKTQQPEKKLEGLSFLFIELPKIHPNNLPVETSRKNWLKFFSEIKDGTIRVSEEIIRYQPTNKALEILEESSYTPAQLEYYDQYWDAVSRERTILGNYERAQRMLEKKDKELEEKDKELEKKDKELEKKDKELEINKKELETKEKELEHNKKELETKEKELEDILKNSIQGMLKAGLAKENIAAILNIDIQTVEKYVK